MVFTFHVASSPRAQTVAPTHSSAANQYSGSKWQSETPSEIIESVCSFLNASAICKISTLCHQWNQDMRSCPSLMNRVARQHSVTFSKHAYSHSGGMAVMCPITGLTTLDDGRLVYSDARGVHIDDWDRHPVYAPPLNIPGRQGCFAPLPGGRLAIGTANGPESEIHLYDLNNATSLLFRSPPFPHDIRSLAVLPDGGIVAGSHGGIQIWNFNDHSMQEVVGETHHVTALALLPNNQFASGSHEGTICIWAQDPNPAPAQRQGQQPWRVRELYRDPPRSRFEPPKSVRDLLSLPCGRLASASQGKAVRLWNLNDGSFQELDAEASQLTLLSDGRLAARTIGGGANNIRVWDWNEGSSHALLPRQNQETVTAIMAFAHNRLAYGSDDHVWDAHMIEIRNLSSREPHFASIANVFCRRQIEDRETDIARHREFFENTLRTAPETMGKLYEMAWKMKGSPQGDPNFGKQVFLGQHPVPMQNLTDFERGVLLWTWHYGQGRDYPSGTLEEKVALRKGAFECILRYVERLLQDGYPEPAMERFEVLPASMKNRIYGHLYHVHAPSGDVPFNYGELAFHGRDGYTSSQQERLMAVQRYFQEGAGGARERY